MFKSCKNNDLQTIIANCNAIGGINKRAWVGKRPLNGLRNVSLNPDGSIYGFDLDPCQVLIKCEGRANNNGADTAFTENDNFTSRDQTVTLVFFHNGDQRLKDAIDRLIDEEELIAVLEAEAGFMEIYGKDNGLKANGGNDGRGITSADPLSTTVTLFAQENEMAKTITRNGDLVQTIEYLDSKLIAQEDFEEISSTTEPVQDLYFINDQIGFRLLQISGSQTQVQKTSNGGSTWITKATVQDIVMQIVFANESNLIAYSNGGNEYFTVNTIAGTVQQKSASIITPGGSTDLGDIVAHKSKIYATITEAAGGISLSVSNDLGNTWSVLTTTNAGAESFLRVNEKGAMITSLDGEVYFYDFENMETVQVAFLQNEPFPMVAGCDLFVTSLDNASPTSLLKFDPASQTLKEVMTPANYISAMAEANGVYYAISQGDGLEHTLYYSTDKGETWVENPNKFGNTPSPSPSRRTSLFAASGTKLFFSNKVEYFAEIGALCESGC